MENAKIRKGISKRKQDRKPKKKKMMKETFVIEYFDVVLLMKQKQRRKKPEIKRQKQGSKRKQKRKTGRKKERKEEERDRERTFEKGGSQKKLRKNKGRHSKINKKCPFLGGQQVFFIRSKERKGKTKTKQQTNKEGLVPSEVALWATSPDP